MNLVLNTESLSYDVDDGTAWEILKKFVTAYSHIVVNRGKGFVEEVYSASRLADIGVGRLPFAKWMHSPGLSKELSMAALAMCGRVRTIPADRLAFDSESEVEVSFFGEDKPLFRYAMDNDGFLLSFDTDERWNVPYLDVRVDYIDDRCGNDERIKNFCDYGCLCEEDEEWLEDAEALTCPTREEWRLNPKKFFPDLIFHEKALGQLKREIQDGWMKPIVEQLADLNRVCHEWTDGDFDKDRFPSRRISPESTQTLEMYPAEYGFVYSGESYRVRYHIRYTAPGNGQGRIYFTPLYDEHECIVYSMTMKFSTVTNP